jgi:hypothetical protein
VTFPTPFTVGLHNYSQGADDGYGNTLPVFTPAKDQPGVEYPVCGWWLPTSVEESGNKRRVITTLVLAAPKSFPANPYDLVDVPADGGTQYEVIGEAEDYNQGPWWQPGVVVWNLQDVSG